MKIHLKAIVPVVALLLVTPLGFAAKNADQAAQDSVKQDRPEQDVAACLADGNGAGLLDIDSDEWDDIQRGNYEHDPDFEDHGVGLIEGRSVRIRGDFDGMHGSGSFYLENDGERILVTGRPGFLGGRGLDEGDDVVITGRFYTGNMRGCGMLSGSRHIVADTAFFD